jgi:hypothetical protein
VSFVDDVDGLNFCHEHDALEGISLYLSDARSKGVPVSLSCFVLLWLYNNRDDLEMVEVV